MIRILRTHRAGFSIAALVLVFILLFAGYTARAQETGNPVTLGVSPQLLDVTANPGERITNTFRLTNGSDIPVAIQTTPKNFTPNGEEGAVSLTEDNTTYAIATWITVAPATATLEPRSTQDFEVIIDVPSDAEPGSHFGSVVFQTIPPENDAAAALISQEIAPVILVRIAGDVVESAEIEEFTTDKLFYSDEDVISFISRIRNTGSVHFKPTGQITVKNIFGSEVATIDLEQKNVLPDSIRQITTDWTDFGFLLGWYTAELTIVTGEDNQISTSSVSFSVFPYQVILPVVIIGGAVIFLLWKGRKRIALAGKALSGKETESGGEKKKSKK